MLKKTFNKTLLLLLFSAICACQTNAQPLFEKYAKFLQKPLSYVCYRTSDKIKIDGKLTEKDWENAPSTAPFSDISGAGFKAPLYQTTAKMLWDDDYLYIGGILEEKDITARLTNHDDIIYHDNDFEVFIDPDGDGQQYFEIENNAKGVVFDLMLNRPYRNGGDFMIQWDCPGLILKVHREGSLNKSNDTDKYWSVEMAIPHKAVTLNFTNTLKAGNTWRINFSRVQWLRKGGPEDNWVWSPIGAIDMHMPERWGYLYFSDKVIGTGSEEFTMPYNENIYKLLWAMFYAQQDKHKKDNNYIRNAHDFFLTDQETQSLPSNSKISVEATSQSFLLSIADTDNSKNYTLDNNGRFKIENIKKKVVKNWVWTGVPKQRSEKEWKDWFKLLKENGISAVLFEGYDENIYKWCHEANLEAHYWLWTLNRAQYMKTHPDWYAVNRKGESALDHPAYVGYYRFLCPNHPGVADTIAEDYLRQANKPYCDGVHLDYVRMPDVILPINLWKNYNIVQTTELPEYDYCYCDVCRKKYKEQTGIDPLDLKYPSEIVSWQNFRFDAVTHVVDCIVKKLKSEDKFVSAAVFPGPSIAKKIVRQDWGNWSLDAYFPMTYNKDYDAGIDWIGRSLQESIKTVGGRANVYPGLHFDHIKGHFIEAIDQAYSNGADGISFFAGPDEECLHLFKQYLDSHNLEAK